MIVTWWSFFFWGGGATPFKKMFGFTTTGSLFCGCCDPPLGRIAARLLPIWRGLQRLLSKPHPILECCFTSQHMAHSYCGVCGEMCRLCHGSYIVACWWRLRWSWLRGYEISHYRAVISSDVVCPPSITIGNESRNGLPISTDKT